MTIELSIIIPFYKGEQYIKDIISSIFLSYLKSNSDFLIEIIIIIDSPNSELETLKSIIIDFSHQNILFKILKNNTNIGVAETRNNGLNNAHGNFITFIDQDDELYENYFLTIIQELSNFNGQSLIVNGNIYSESINKRIPFYYLPPKLSVKNLIRRNSIFTPGQIICKKKFLIENNITFKQIHPCYPGSDDLFFNIKLFLSLKEDDYKYCSKKIFKYKIHQSNYSHDIEKSIKSCIFTLFYFKNLDSDLISQKIETLQYSISLLKKRNKKLRFKHLYYMILLMSYNMNINTMVGYIHKRIINMKIRPV